MQNAIVDIYQEFAPHADWIDGGEITEPVHIENIKQVPITFFTATKDRTCGYEHALEYIPQIQSVTERIDVEGKGHLWFSSKANDEWFMEKLIEQLQVPE